MQHRLARRLLAACWAAVLVGLAFGTFAVAAPAGAADVDPARDSSPSTSISLLAQQPWVSATSGVRLSLGVDSPLPASRLGLKVVLYSEVHTRDAFEQTLEGAEPESEVPIDSEPSGRTIPLAGIDQNGRIDLHFPVRTNGPGGGALRSPTLSLDCTGYCPGVYPLELVLFDTELGTQLASVTTYLVYAPPQSGALKLDVSLVLPLGYQPALAPGGAPALDSSRLGALASVAGELDDLTPGSLSVALNAQLLVALAHEPKSSEAHLVLSRLTRALGGSSPPQELVPAPFAPIDPSSLAASNLGNDLGVQLGIARRVESATLKRSPAATPYVDTASLDPAALRLLQAAGVGGIVVPPTSVSATLPAGTVVSPFRLVGAAHSSGGLVFLSDPALATPFSSPGDRGALAAEQFLAELAVVYFEEPFLSTQRAVVITPTTNGGANFLASVLDGLTDSPLVQPVSVSALFNLFSNARDLPATRLVEARPSDLIPGHVVDGARRTLATLQSVVPGSRALTTAVTESILLGESAAMPASERFAYEQAPAAALGAIGRSLSLVGSRTITLTARTGRVPVTVSSQFPGVVHLVLTVRSSDLTFPGGDHFPLQLSPRAGTSTSVTVRSLTSGVTTLEITLVAPVGTHVLAAEQFSIRSTAISGVAIGLSIGALAVLAIWWARSWRRHRRRSPRTRPAPATGGNDLPATAS